MGYEDLVKKVRKIRSARVDAIAASQNKPTRQARPKKDPKEKLIDSMTDDQKAELIKMLEAQNESKTG